MKLQMKKFVFFFLICVYILYIYYIYLIICVDDNSESVLYASGRSNNAILNDKCMSW